MLVNIIQNTISSFISAGFSVITTNLKMWLGFETSVANQEQVVDGDFPTGTTAWNLTRSSISNNTAIIETTTGQLTSISQSVFAIGRTYLISLDIADLVGEVEVNTTGGTSVGVFITTNGTKSFYFTPAGTDIEIKRKFGETNVYATISNVSVKELTQITPDKSGNNNVGELFTGKALDFNGSTDYVSANSLAGTLSTGDAFTFAVWFNSEKTPTDYFRNILISSGGPEQYTNIFKIGVNPQTSATGSANVGGIFFADSAGGYNNVVPSSGGVNYNDGEWHRLVVSRRAGSGVQDLSFYVDGSYIGKADCNPYWNNVDLFDFGQEWDGAGTSDHFEGKMSDIQVYDYAWTSDDVTYDYANPQNLVTDRSGTSIGLSNLKGYWHLSEGAGSLVYDSSGEGNNGTINGATYEPAQPRIPQLGMMNFSNGAVATGVTLIPDPNNTSQDIDGNAVRDRLNSFNLDGSGYSSVANSSTLQFGTSAFTIQAWIKPFSLAANNRILTKGVTGNGEFMISVGGDGASARVYAKDSSNNALDTSNDFSSLTINSWQMITVIIDTPNDQILFFKNDGNVETKTGASWTGNFNNTEPITIGNTSSVSAGQFFDGLVSDTLVYDRALTSDEVENNYNAGLSAHTN